MKSVFVAMMQLIVFGRLAHPLVDYAVSYVAKRNNMDANGHKMRSILAASVTVISLSFILAFSACTAAIPPQGAGTAAAGLSVTGVAIGTQINVDRTVTNDISDFSVRDTIYVSVKTHGSGSGTSAPGGPITISW